MKKSLTANEILSLLLFIFVLAGNELNAQKLEYRFKNDFNATSLSPPPLYALSTGNFQNDTLSEITCIPQITYHFDLDNGIQFNNNSANQFLSDNYSVELYFKFDNTGGYCKIIDFKNPYNDIGLYCTETLFQFYPLPQVATTAFSSGQYVHLVLTRDSLTDLVSIYVDGALGFSFTDSTDLAVLDNSNLLSFFMDDGSEESSGNISLLRLYKNVLDASEVNTSYNDLHTDLSPIAVSVNNSMQCLNGNVFSFLADNSDSLNTYNYNWNFGDGQSAITAGSNNTYLNPGNYTATVTINTGTCFDSNSVQVVVNSNPVLYLGMDTGFCTGGNLSLDAGSGFTDYLWSDASTGQLFSTQISGTFWAKITDTNGCESTDSITVSVFNLPNLYIGNDTSICPGSALNLDAGSGFTNYLWSDGSTGQLLPAQSAGTFWAKITDSNGCENSDTISVSVFNLPVVNIGNDTAVCNGLYINLDAGTGFNSYLWSDGSTNQMFTAQSAGIYWANITDSNGCENIDSITISGITLPVINLGNDTTICTGLFLDLDAGPGFNGYLWSDGSTNQLFSAQSAGIYGVKITNSNGCESSDSITVSVFNLPILNVGNDTTICTGLSLNLDAGAGFSSYLWSDGTTNQLFSVQASGIYWTKITDTNGCENTDSIVISFLNLANFNIGSDTTICSGGSLNLDAGSGFSSYVWSNFSSSQSINVNANGVYTVTVVDTNGCVGIDSIGVSLAPLPAVNLGNYMLLCSGSSLTLDAGPGFADYLWNNSQQSQTIIVTSPGIYVVTVTNNNGCVNSDDIIVAGAALPTVNLGPDTSFCKGIALILDAGAGQQAYKWQNNSISQFFTVTLSGTYSVQVTDHNGCTNTDDIIVSVHGLPLTASISLQNDTLFSSISYGNQWYNSSGMIQGANKRFYVPLVNDNYYVIRENGFACLSDTSNQLFYSISGIVYLEKQPFTIGPNPASNQLRIEFTNAEAGNAEIILRNTLGEIVMNKSFSLNEQSITIAINTLATGLYSFELKFKNDIWTQKILIIK